MSLRACDRSQGQSSIVFDSLSLARVGDLGAAALARRLLRESIGHALSKFVARRRVERLLRCGFTWLSDGKEKAESWKDEEAWGGAPRDAEIARINGGGVVRKACGGAGSAAGAGWVS